MLKKLLLIITLLSLSNVAMAEFIFIGSALDETTYVYADPSTIIRSKNISKMWDLFSFTSIQTISGSGEPFLSSITYAEYDCVQKTGKTLSEVRYSGGMRSGKIVSSYNYNDGRIVNVHEPIIPDSLSESLWKIACGKKL